VIIEDFNSDQYQKKQMHDSMNIASINFRLHNSSLNRFAVFDGKDAMISTDARKISEGTSSLWTTDTNLIGILNGYFETAWNESNELKQKQIVTKVTNRPIAKNFVQNCQI
jgi:hypothetical protein